MTERDAVFRDQLIALVTALNCEEGTDSELRRLVGGYAVQMARQAKTLNWLDLKTRADGPTYDSMLHLFERQSTERQKAADNRAVRATEVLAISLIARRQQQADLLPGIGFVDRYIEACERELRQAPARPSGKAN